MNHIPSTYTILHRTDTNEYLVHFECWDRNSMRWSVNVDEAFQFKTHSDAETNGRMVLDWLGDPLNRTVKLVYTIAGVRGNRLVFGSCFPLNVTRVT